MHPPAQRELAAYGGARLFAGKRVLDIGCGDGRLALGCARVASAVLGIDPDRGAIAAARARARTRGMRTTRFRVGVSEDLPVPDQSYDVALLSWSL